MHANVVRFDRGFAKLYHAARPALDIDTLRHLLSTVRGSDRAIDTLVDLGCGTGLSTFPWGPYVHRVIGIEPSSDMRTVAEGARASPAAHANISFVSGTSEATGMEPRSVDVITVSQALHWMDPVPTFTEAARILRPGGVFVAYDCDWPPLCGVSAMKAYEAFITRVEGVERSRSASTGVVKHAKAQHAARMAASGMFADVRDVCAHQKGGGDAEALVQLALSQGSVQATLAAGATEEELGVGTLRAAVEACFGGRGVATEWMWSYRVRIGVMATV